jgi:CRP-like cAMP-binding protein
MPDLAAISQVDLEDSLWYRLGNRFGLVSLRPRLVDDAKVEKREDTLMLVCRSRDSELELSAAEARLIPDFDGTKTISEMVLAELGQQGRLEIEPILNLVDRVMRAEMLENFPPNMFRQLDAHLEQRAVRVVVPGKPVGHEPIPDPVHAHDHDEDADGDDGAPVSDFEQAPWRPRTPMLAERVRFLRSMELLRGLDLPTLGSLAEALHEEAFPAASNIVKEGQESDRFFIIRSGEANVLARVEGELRRVAKLGPGDYFGESGLLDNTIRNATVRSSPARPLVAYTVEGDTFERIISPHVAAFRGRQLVSKRRARLQEVALFSSLGDAELERLARIMHEHHVPEGRTIFEQGEVGDRLYVIVEGGASVIRDGVPVAELGEGDFFGETALLFTTQRTATVTASQDSTIWSLDKPAFEALMRGYMLGRRDMMPTLLNRAR